MALLKVTTKMKCVCMIMQNKSLYSQADSEFQPRKRPRKARPLPGPTDRDPPGRASGMLGQHCEVVHPMQYNESFISIKDQAPASCHTQCLYGVTQYLTIDNCTLLSSALCFAALRIVYVLLTPDDGLCHCLHFVHLTAAK